MKLVLFFCRYSSDNSYDFGHWNELFMSVYRAPATALMPDTTPAGLRSRANGIITAMGGLGTIIAFSLGGKLFNINYRLPFYCWRLLWWWL